MKIKNLFFFLAALAIPFTSCNNDDDNDASGSKSYLTFNSSISGTKASLAKAANTEWASGDAIGVFMKTGSGLSNIVDNAQNKKHVTPGNGNFSPSDPQADAIQFPSDGSNVDFIAYYPYTASLAANNVYKVNVATQSQQEDIDLLYSNNATGLNKTSASVDLHFSHQLVKIALEIKGQGDITNLSGLSVKLSGTNTTADFSLANGSLSNLATSADITFKTSTSGILATSEAIILPAAATSGRIISFVVDSKTFKWEVPATTEFQKGLKYKYNVILKDGAAGPEVTVTPTASITDWADGGASDVELESDENGDGTKASPYTVSQVAAKVGESGKWIEGYIVGSTAKTKSFGTDVKTNILLATAADETDEAKCVIVNLEGSAVQNNLDIVANPTLKGKLIKIQGDIVNSLFGGAIAITSVIAQEGGAEAGGSEPTGEVTEFLNETFGENYTKPSTGWLKIDAYTAWDMSAPVIYSDQYGNADIRNTSTLDNNVWLPASKNSELKITGFGLGYKNVKLTFDIAGNTAGTNANCIEIQADGMPLAVQPDITFEKANTYSTVELSIPDGTSSITFFGNAEINTKGFRIDNISLKGVK